jgi:hypothetical protein
MISEHLAIGSNNFAGIFNRGIDQSVPADHFIDAQNIIFDTNATLTRDGSIVDLPVSKVILRTRSYEKTGEATRYLILDDGGRLYDSTLLGSPILTIPQMTDFALQVMFDRAYISPHDGNTGLPGQFVYVYDGTGVARLAGGPAPSGTLTCTTSTAAGNIEAGAHLFAVSFETSSGYITKRSAATSYVAPGGKSVVISNIPIGPAGTVARWIVATKLILLYGGDQQAYEYFYVPNGRIGDNTTTTITLSFFDSELAASADFLYDQLDKIPAGNYLGIFKGALVVTGENINPARVRVSLFNQPESFDSVEGFVDVYPKDNGGPVRNCIEFRSQLIIHKSYRSYITSDNNDTPATWTVGPLDKSVGSECNGLCRILDVDGTSNDNFIVVSRAGLAIFSGSYSDNLSYKIDDIWLRINKLYFHKILVAYNPIMGRLYVAVPLDNAVECSHILHADLNEGFTSQAIKWSVWKMKGGIHLSGCFVDIQFANKVAVLKFSGYDGNIYRLAPGVKDDDGVAIESFIRFAFITPDPRGGICLFSGLRLIVKGVGDLQLRIYSIDDAYILDTPTISLSLNPGIQKTREFLFENERASCQIKVDKFGEWFSLRDYRVFGIPIWAERATE